MLATRWVAVLAALVLGGCAGASTAQSSDPSPDAPVTTEAPTTQAPTAAAGGGAAGTCPVGTPNCVDTPGIGTEDAADLPTELWTEEARRLVGAPDDEVPDSVRIARRGDEQYMLTEDYVLGRITVELERDALGDFAVVSSTVELPEGPRTFTEDDVLRTD